MPVVRTLIIINVVAYLLVWLTKTSIGMLAFDVLALHNWLSPNFKPWQLITHMFLHDMGGIFHLFFNMLALYMFGTALEQTWGPKRFVFYYFVCGIGAAILHNTVVAIQLQPMIEAADVYLSQPSYTAFESFVSSYLPGSYDNNEINKFLTAWEAQRNNIDAISKSREIVSEIVDLRINTPTVGASGAIYGLLLAFGMTFPNAMIMMLIPPIPMKAKYFVLVFGIIELWTGLKAELEDPVAHFAHLGGMLFGILLIFYFRKQDKNKYRYL